MRTRFAAVPYSTVDTRTTAEIASGKRPPKGALGSNWWAVADFDQTPSKHVPKTECKGHTTAARRAQKLNEKNHERNH